MHAKLARASFSSLVDELTVVVLNWGSPELTIQCVRSLLDDGVPPPRVVIVDNGSEDDSYGQFQAEFPGCVLLRIEQNVGFARAANAGARLLPGEAYLFVDNDAFVHRPGSVDALLRCLSDESVGIVMARIVSEDLTVQKTVHPIQTPAVAPMLWTGLSRLLPNRWQAVWGRHWDHSESREIAAAAGVVMLVRGALWDELGGYPEDAVVYAEDIDMCWRARRRGSKVWFTSAAEFLHLGSATIARDFDRARRAELIGRAEAAMTLRNLSRPSAFLVLTTKAGGLGVRWLFLRITRREAESAIAKAELRGTLHPVRNR
jgi:N-acetylglucosaminyl-diphospho-decaprenol L-rhamnosyltransferase